MGFAVEGKVSSHGVSMPTFWTPWPGLVSTCPRLYSKDRDRLDKVKLYQERIRQSAAAKVSMMNAAHEAACSTSVLVLVEEGIY